MSQIKQFLAEHHVRIKRIILLKVAIAGGLVISHYFPGPAGLFTNLLWLFLF